VSAYKNKSIGMTCKTTQARAAHWIGPIGEFETVPRWMISVSNLCDVGHTAPERNLLRTQRLKSSAKCNIWHFWFNNINSSCIYYYIRSEQPLWSNLPVQINLRRRFWPTVPGLLMDWIRIAKALRACLISLSFF
jgi:hypothetical protein